MQYSNYHSHCTFCDGRSHPEDFVRFALSNHFRAYGFSSHSPLPFETNWNMSKADIYEYITEIDRLKKKYEDQIEIYTGLEIDYLDPTYNAAIPFFTELPLDYRIGSIHYVPLSDRLIEEEMVCIDGSFRDFAHKVIDCFDGDIRQMGERYFDSMQQMIEIGGFDIVGHMDKIYMNSEHFSDFSIEADWYRKRMNDCLHLIAEKGLMIEINCKNLTKKQQIFPHEKYMKLICQLQIPVMVNSDCHYPNLVNDGREGTFQILKEAGFKTTRELIKGEWQDVAL